MTGATGTGKSTLGLALFLSAAAPRLVIDPADSSLTAVDGAVTFRDPARPPRDAATARFVPRDPGDLDAYDRVYRWVYSAGPRWVWLDEAGIAAPAQGSPRFVRTVLVQGRKLGVGHMAMHTRPRELDPNVVAQAQHVIVFPLPNPDDRRRVADLAGLDRRVLEAELAALEPFGFLWWDQRRRTLTACPPIRGRR